jgi:hypothetical protein
MLFVRHVNASRIVVRTVVAGEHRIDRLLVVGVTMVFAVVRMPMIVGRLASRGRRFGTKSRQPIQMYMGAKVMVSRLESMRMRNRCHLTGEVTHDQHGS